MDTHVLDAVDPHPRMQTLLRHDGDRGPHWERVRLPVRNRLIHVLSAFLRERSTGDDQEGLLAVVLLARLGEIGVGFDQRFFTPARNGVGVPDQWRVSARSRSVVSDRRQLERQLT